LVSFADSLRVKRIDAGREAALLEPRDHLADTRERLHRRAAKVDNVGAAGVEVLGLREDVSKGHPVRLDDLGEYLRVILAVPLEVELLPKERGQILEV